MSNRPPYDGPSRLIPGRVPIDPEQAKAWFRRTFGEMPVPALDTDARSAEAARERRQDALATLERTIPAAYRWARFSAPELPIRVGAAMRQVLEDASWRHAKLVFMGNAGAGKTALAVACLRRWTVESVESGEGAAFVHAYALGVARLQHAAGHGEPEVVERAMKSPTVLVDDLGSERDIAGGAAADVIYVRHAEDRRLWVTTGLTRPQLLTRYGEGIVRRLFERATVIQMGQGMTKEG
jgi:DNA replication protein DnaC